MFLLNRFNKWLKKEEKKIQKDNVSKQERKLIQSEKNFQHKKFRRQTKKLYEEKNKKFDEKLVNYPFRFIRVTTKITGENLRLVFKNGVLNFNFINPFYSLPKKVLKYFSIFFLICFIGIGFPLGWDYTMIYIFKVDNPNVIIGVTEEAAYIIIIGCIAALSAFQLSVFGYAYLSKQAFAKTSLEMETNLIRLRWFALASVFLNVAFSIITLINVNWGVFTNTPEAAATLTVAGICISFILTIVTIVIYRVQSSKLRVVVFKQMKDNFIDSSLLKEINDRIEAIRSKNTRLTDKQILRDKEIQFKINEIVHSKHKEFQERNEKRLKTFTTYTKKLTSSINHKLNNDESSTIVKDDKSNTKSKANKSNGKTSKNEFNKTESINKGKK